MDVYRGPIGKGDTLESPLWAFYRDWLYREEKGPSFMREKSRKTSNLARIWSRKIAESRELVHPGQKIIFYRLEASE